MSNRAKIFSPFAALRGYEDEIVSEGREIISKETESSCLKKASGSEPNDQPASERTRAHIKYFTDGCYENIAGVLDAVDVINKELRILHRIYK